MLVKEIEAPEFRARVSAKFGIDLEPLRLEMTFRRFSEASDGNVHNDSRVKVVTALIYFNETWPHPGGRLRLLRSSTDVRDYAAEVEPVAGNLVVFRRSETSFHGFEPFVGERRSLQMYWVRPKKRKRGDKQTGEWLRRFKRLFKRG
jgi:Rps23 Pro-64 3,4-dihydroxylase Tpa1-like proline 4-hydroxylase